MAKYSDITELEDQLAEALARIETLQTSAADAEARAMTMRGELQAATNAQDELRTKLADAEAERDSANSRVVQLEADGEGLRGQLRDAAIKYREARFAATPDVPQDLVPELASIEDIDREFESAVRVVGQLREKLEKEAADQKRTARVPVGSPARRQQDLSSLSPSEKIRLGLQRLEERA